MNDPAQDFIPATVHALPSVPQRIDEEDIDIGEFLGLFWGRKWLILILMALAMALGIFYALNIPPLYPAEAKLILESEEQNATGLESLVPGLSDDDTEMNTQIEIIKSRRLIKQVVEELKLYDDEEFVPSLGGPSFYKRAIDEIKSLIGLEIENTEPTKDMLSQMAVDVLIENLDASVQTKTFVFNISLETRNPDKSVLIVNTLSDFFVTDQITTKNISTNAAAEWLDEKVEALGEKLGTAEAEAANFRSQTERVVTERDLAQSNLNLKNARGRLDSFTANLQATTGSRIPTTERDLARRDALKRDMAQLEAIVEKQTQDLLTIRQLDREALAAGTIYEHFVQRRNEIDVQQGLQKSDVRVLSSAVPRTTATKPKKALIVALFTILGLIAGVGYILVRKFMDHTFNDPMELQRTFGIPVIGTIATAPKLVPFGFKTKGREKRKRQALLSYVMRKPSSSVMESVRDFRTSLLTSERVDGKPVNTAGNVVIFTSSVPAEGKTTSSVLLAINSAALNKRVLLIECDLRLSTFQTYFGLRTNMGLIDAIQAGENWREAVWSDHEEDNPDPKKPQRRSMNMDIIFGGVSKKRNAADIFASEDFEQFIKRIKSEYDLIILDAPPVLPVPDARLIAKFSDKIVYVVSAGKTPSNTVTAGLRLLDNMNLKPDGFVLTQIKKNDSYGGYGYGHGSKYHKN